MKPVMLNLCRCFQGIAIWAAGMTFGFPSLARADVSFAEAVDFPGFAPTVYGGAWRGIVGTGHDGTDAVSSPATWVYTSGMMFSRPLPNSAVDGGFWWRKDTASGVVRFATRIQPSGFRHLVVSPQGTGAWESLRFHLDRNPQRVEWQLDPNVEFIPAGDFLLGQLTWGSGSVDSFRKALDGDDPGAGAVSIHGWYSFGAAMAMVTNDDAFSGGDCLEIRSDPAAANPGAPGTQSTSLVTIIGLGNELVFRAKRGANAGVSLSATVAPATFHGLHSVTPVPVAITLTPAWTEIRLAVPALPNYGERELRPTFTVPGNDPGAFIRLDAMSLQSNYDLNSLLETDGLTWTEGGAGVFEAVTDNISDPPSAWPGYTGTFDGLRPSLEQTGDSAWVEATFTGPGSVVFAGLDAEVDYGRSYFKAELLVDSQLRDERHIGAGPFWLQAHLDAGPHVVRWQVTATTDYPAGAGDARLHSCALVPDAPDSEVDELLNAAFPNQTWQHGGNPPDLLHRVIEGATSIRGIRLLPASGEVPPTWLQTAVSGPADAHVIWDSAADSFCHVDGRKTAGPVSPLPYVSGITATMLHLPAGPHTIRWEGGTAPANWRDFSVSPGSPIAEYLAGTVAPSQLPLIWVSQTSPATYTRQWSVSTDPDLYNYEGVLIPGSGEPALGGADRTYGRFRTNGPGTLFLEIRQKAYEVVFIMVGNVTHYPDENQLYDFEWHPSALSIPPGEHEITVAAFYDDLGMADYVWLRNLRIVHSGPYITWAAARSLPLIDSHPSGDSDRDGQENLLEFAFGTDPSSANGFPMPAITTVANTRRLQLPALPHDAAGLTYEVQISADLQTWTTFATVNPNAAPAHEPGPLVTLPPASGAKEFLRIIVTL